MQRINAHRGRWGYDRQFRTWDEIEAEYKKVFTDTYWPDIKDKLTELLRVADPKYHVIINRCITDTPKWITAKPLELSLVKKYVDDSFSDWKETVHTDFRKALNDAYGYKHDKLLFLAKMLNVKTCPYCNMQYTLCAEAYKDGELVEKMAKFQYDHFFDKAEYPMLSMSLYNLIPSCASCNQGKSKRPLSMAFHPYSTAIKDTFRFRVKDPSDLLAGGDDKKIEIKLVPQKPVDVDAYNEMFHIESLYQRHRDVAREVFARAYVDPYYEDGSNFEFLKDSNFMERLEKGFYPDEEDIDKRPLTKLQQDLWKQAKGEL